MSQILDVLQDAAACVVPKRGDNGLCAFLCIEKRTHLARVIVARYYVIDLLKQTPSNAV